MAVYGYSRVSTSRQAEEGESLDVQQRTVAGYRHPDGKRVAGPGRLADRGYEGC